ncbi:MAG: 50S ribosomal protein L24 [Candidatus Altiarchaeota archaeon]|nr:50S ribosomal protein L24 [Candidatus Altiarchaeota archaeon]
MKVKMNVHLDKVLSEKYSRKNAPIRTGDRVKVIKGTFKDKTGKVASVDKKKTRVRIEGVEVSKANSSKVMVPIHFSNIEIKELDLKDKKRKAKFQIKKKETKEGK